MSSSLTEITGSEARQGDGSALDALIVFYSAFNSRNLDALAVNWAQGDAPSMDNPIGGIRRGWRAIKEGYLDLFAGPASIRVTFHDFTSQGGAAWHLFVGREKGTCSVSNTTIELRIRTTRWFTRQGGIWRQLHHHGSIDEPALLADYQNTILGHG